MLHVLGQQSDQKKGSMLMADDKKDEVIYLDENHALKGGNMLLCEVPIKESWREEIPVGINPSLEGCPRCGAAFPAARIPAA